LRLLPFILVIAAVIVGYRLVLRRDDTGPGIGPQGRFWWLKLLVALLVTVAVLVALIWGYLTFVQNA